MGEGGGGGGLRVDMNKELVIVKIAKKLWGVRSWGRGQSGCERRIEVILNMQTKRRKKRLGWGPL